MLLTRVTDEPQRGADDGAEPALSRAAGADTGQHVEEKRILAPQPGTENVFTRSSTRY